MTGVNQEIWTVVVVAEEQAMSRIYQLPSYTTIGEVLQVWTNDLDKDGHWALMTDNKEGVYPEDFSLEMIGETTKGSKIVNFRVEESPEPTPRPVTDIFVFLEGKCHHLHVCPNDRLWRILPRRHSIEFEFAGKPLDLSLSIQQSQLYNNAVIYEACCRVPVKLSSGAVKSIQVSKSSVVHHLKSKLQVYESGEFDLKYCGRVLDLAESVRDLQKTVEVVKTEFEVQVGDKTYRLKTGRGAIKFNEFVGALSVESGLQFLEQCQFYCRGCGRCITKAEEEIQILRIGCCGIESLKLICNGQEMKECWTSTDTAVPRLHRPNQIPCLYGRMKGKKYVRNRSLAKKTVQVTNLGFHNFRKEDRCLETDLALPQTLAKISDASGTIRGENRHKKQFRLYFPPQSERRNAIVPGFLTNPIVKVPLYVRNQIDGGRDCVLTLPDQSDASDAQWIIADELKVNWYEIKLMRWTAELPGGRICVHICADDGSFAEGHSQVAEFGDKNGGIHSKRELNNLKCVILKDEDYVWAVQQRRIVIYVTSAK